MAALADRMSAGVSRFASLRSFDVGQLMMRFRTHIRRAALAPVFAALLAVPNAARTAEAPKQTLAYVISTWDNALYETRFADECPDGLTIGNDELWWRGLARPDRDKLTNRGLIQQVD